MDAGESIALLSLFLGGLLLAGGLFGAWALGRMQAERKILDERQGDDQLDSRLARIERVIDAMALDMERLAEAQRYAARRIAANEPRATADVPSAPPPDSTL
jgi:regulator of sirC expression with transglutaminase-like and TPR domain